MTLYTIPKEKHDNINEHRAILVFRYNNTTTIPQTLINSLCPLSMSDGSLAGKRWPLKHRSIVRIPEAAYEFPNNAYL